MYFKKHQGWSFWGSSPSRNLIMLPLKQSFSRKVRFFVCQDCAGRKAKDVRSGVLEPFLADIQKFYRIQPRGEYDSFYVHKSIQPHWAIDQRTKAVTWLYHLPRHSASAAEEMLLQFAENLPWLQTSPGRLARHRKMCRGVIRSWHKLLPLPWFSKSRVSWGEPQYWRNLHVHAQDNYADTVNRRNADSPVY